MLTYFMLYDAIFSVPRETRSSSYTPNIFVHTLKTNASDVSNEERIAYLDDGNMLWNKIRFMNIKDAVDFMRYEIEQIQKQEQLESGYQLIQVLCMFPAYRRSGPDLGMIMI